MARLSAKPAMPWAGLAAALVVGVFVESPPLLASPRECVFVTNTDSDTVSIIDTATNRVTRTIRLSLVNQCTEARPRGVRPLGVAVTPDGARAYVTTDACFIVVLDTVTRHIADYVLPERNRFLNWGLTISPDGSFAYFTTWRVGLDDGVLVVDTGTNKAVSAVPVGQDEYPSDIALTSDGRFAYVVNNGDSGPEPETVSVIDTVNNLVTATITVGNFPDQIAIAPDGTFAYVMNSGDGTTSVIDTAANVVTAVIPYVGGDVVFAPDGKAAYVSTCGEGVCVIDTLTRQVTNIIPAPFANSLAIAVDGRSVYATHAQRGTVSVIDTATSTLVATIPIPDCGTYRNPFAPCSPTGIAIGTLPRGCPVCPGDCDHNGDVAVYELAAAADIALGTKPLDACDSSDTDANALVTVDEILQAVTRALDGCP